MKKPFVAILSLVTVCTLGQTVGPQVIGSAGGSGTTGSVSLEWTVGEIAVSRISNGTNTLTQGFHQGGEVKISINISAFFARPL